MIVHNDIHQILVDISSEQGWNEESQILHLCGFLSRLQPYISEATEQACRCTKTVRCFTCRIVAVGSFQKYLQEVADEENAGVEAVCEVCDAPCDYHPELCLCKNCQIEEASA